MTSKKTKMTKLKKKVLNQKVLKTNSNFEGISVETA